MYECEISRDLDVFNMRAITRGYQSTGECSLYHGRRNCFRAVANVPSMAEAAKIARSKVVTYLEQAGQLEARNIYQVSADSTSPAWSSTANTWSAMLYRTDVVRTPAVQ